MFTSYFFPHRYFAPRYFPEHGSGSSPKGGIYYAPRYFAPAYFPWA